MRKFKISIFFGFFLLLIAFLFSQPHAQGTTISGDVTSSSFTFSGPMSVSSVTVTDNLKVLGSSVNFSNAILSAIGAGALAGDAVQLSQLKILQVKMSTSTTSSNTTSTSFVSTNLTGMITPSNTSSKVLIVALGSVRPNNSAGYNIYYSLYRDSTNLGNGNDGFGRTTFNGGADGIVPCTMIYLDSPASSSSLTYKAAIRTDGAPSGVIWGINGTQVMVLMEVNGL